MRKKGYFISFEGIDGSGKSTQIKKLARFLESLDFDVIITREPGGSVGGEEIRNLLIKLDTTADQIVRKNEEVYKKLNLKDSDQDLLIENISKNPILLERPIVVKGEKAIIGRPPENVMKLLSGPRAYRSQRE